MPLTEDDKNHIASLLQAAQAALDAASQDAAMLETAGEYAKAKALRDSINQQQMKIEQLRAATT